MKNAEVTVRVILDHEEGPELTAEEIASELVTVLEERETVWLNGDRSCYIVRYVALEGTKVARETRTGLTCAECKEVGGRHYDWCSQGT